MNRQRDTPSKLRWLVAEALAIKQVKVLGVEVPLEFLQELMAYIDAGVEQAAESAATATQLCEEVQRLKMAIEKASEWGWCRESRLLRGKSDGMARIYYNATTADMLVRNSVIRDLFKHTNPEVIIVMTVTE